jgi:hypothetical protein
MPTANKAIMFIAFSVPFCALLLFCTFTAGFVAIAEAQSSDSHSHPNGGPSRAAPGAVVYFIELKSGDTLQAKSIIRFGLRNMSVSPAGIDRQNAGHHHLLIDTDLPPLDEPIPNDLNHLHFGAGETEAEITLTPGTHTLQLLMGDKDHIPHTAPVISERLRVKVVDTEKNKEVQSFGTTPSPPNAKVYIASPSPGACISSHSVIRFGLIGMGIAPAGIEKANTGHHHLLIDSDLPPLDKPVPSDETHLHFGAGETEAEVTLSPGRHKLQLLFADDQHIPHNPPVYSQPIDVIVGCKTSRRKHRMR